MDRIQQQLKLITDRHDKYLSTVRPRLDKERDRLQLRRQKIDDYIKRTEVRKQEIKNMIVIRTDAYNSAVEKYKLKEKKFAKKIKEFEDKISKLKNESPSIPSKDSPGDILTKAMIFASQIERAFYYYFEKNKPSKKLGQILREYQYDYSEVISSLEILLKNDSLPFSSHYSILYEKGVPEDVAKKLIHTNLSEPEQIKAIKKDYNDFIENVQANVDEFQKL